MSRPKPTVIVEYKDEKTGKVEQILSATGIFVVTYDGQPINVKVFNAYFDYPGAKYKKTMFPSAAHAINLAEKLNEVHKTDKFRVVEIGDTVDSIDNTVNDK